MRDNYKLVLAAVSVVAIIIIAVLVRRIRKGKDEAFTDAKLTSWACAGANSEACPEGMREVAYQRDRSSPHGIKCIGDKPPSFQMRERKVCE